jgi:hypothetical protein
MEEGAMKSKIVLILTLVFALVSNIAIDVNNVGLIGLVESFLSVLLRFVLFIWLISAWATTARS